MRSDAGHQQAQGQDYPVGGVARQGRDVSICRERVVQARLARSALTSARRRSHDRAP